MVSEARLRANRLNAQKSTGPKTDDGKAASRRNALKHGLTGSGVVLPSQDSEEVKKRADELGASLRPVGLLQVWLISRIALETVRLEACRRHDLALRGVRAERASACWAEDRGDEIAAVAAKLAKNPSRTVAKLRTSAAGCDWLIARWEGLEFVLDTDGAWGDSHRSVALDLLGVPRDVRSGSGDRRMAIGAPPDVLHALVCEQIAALEALKARGLDDLDELERDLTAADLSPDVGRDARLLRGYERESRKSLEWAWDQLARLRRDPEALAMSPPIDLDVPRAWRSKRAAAATVECPTPAPETNPTAAATASVIAAPETNPTAAAPTAARPRPSLAAMAAARMKLSSAFAPAAPSNRRERRAMGV